MTLPHALPAPVRGLIETLATCADSPLRGRLLLEGVLALQAASAVSLWRLLEPLGGSEAAGGAPEWRCVLERGPHDALPPAAEIRAVLAGELDARLPHRRLVLATGRGEPRAALVLGDVHEDEDRLDLVESLLACWAAADLGHSELLEGLSAPLGRPRGQTDGGLTHDLRNLLAGIRATVEVLDGFGAELEEDERAGFEETVARECRRAGHLLAELQGAGSTQESAPRTSKGTGGPQGADLLAVVEDVVRSERTACERAGLELALEVRPGAAELETRLPEHDWERILRNLLVNAREALGLRGSGTIRVALGATSTPGPGALLTVRDDGPGVPAELRARLFERGRSGKPRTPGARRGQGLSNVRDLAQRAGGTATYHDRDVGGALFRIWVPRVATAPPGRA